MPTLSKVSQLVMFIVAVDLCVLAQSTGHGTATISGRVTIGGKGAAQVAVVLKPAISDPTQEMMERYTGSPGLTRTTTGPDGGYQFPGLPAGRYTIKPYAVALVPVDPSDNPVPVTVAEGQTVGNINFSLAPGGVITGKISTPDGRPLIAASVHAQPARISNGGPIKDSAASRDDGSVVPVPASIGPGPAISDRFATTDDRGVYRIFGMAAGTYFVSAAPGNVPNGRVGPEPKTFYPAGDAASATPVRVEAGKQTTGIDLVFGAEPSATYSASGKVLDESGRPVQQVAISYLVTGEYSNDGEPFGQPRTNSAGEFKITGLRAGSYTASAKSISMFGSSDFYSDETTFEIHDANISDLEIRVHSGMTVSGNVVIEGTDDPQAIASLAGQQISGVADSEGRPDIFYSDVGADGSFTVKHIPPGLFKISDVSNPNVKTGKIQFHVMRIEQNGEVIADEMMVAPGQSVSGLRVIVQQAGCAISGHVAITGGSVAPTAILKVYVRTQSANPNSDPAATVLFETSRSFIHKEAEVGQNGDFRIDGLIPETYVIYVELEAPRSSPDILQGEVAKDVVTIVGNGSEVQVELTADLSRLGKRN